MKGIDPSLRKIVQELFKSTNGLEAFSIFKRSGLSNPEFIKAVNTGISQGYIEITDPELQRIELTKDGVEIALTSQRNIEGEYSWRQIPPEFQTNPIEKDEYYVPNVYLLDKSFSS